MQFRSMYVQFELSKVIKEMWRKWYRLLINYQTQFSGNKLIIETKEGANNPLHDETIIRTYKFLFQ